ncbi:hypothetical protein [Spirosoma validum]|uniref:Uncharacterized protein n=1 Tax=Spirosoma validum TaxID=2771355 RepID=A0A927GCT7_9BACT|nr:hypothetical protein [Spirosoma validum]MBD2753082.1 hypothetical protein [Spirosoma validum]
MAELEVAKHTKKIYKILRDPAPAWWHKLKELALEIFIIVFAVTISIWFHELAEHRHEKEIESRFLAGLHHDISADVTEMMNDSADLALQYKSVDLGSTLINRDSITDDSLQNFLTLNGPLLYAMTLFEPNHGRYEGFKSAGHLRLIENELLGDKIIAFYEEGLPHLVYIERMYIDFKLANFDTYNLRKDEASLEKAYLRKYFVYVKESLALLKQENNRSLKEAREILRLLTPKKFINTIRQ